MTGARLAIGCEALGGTDWGAVDIAEVERAIRSALDHGVRAFDTADVYGLGASESRLAHVLGPMRSEVTISTKGGVAWDLVPGSSRARTRIDLSPDHLARAIEASRRRLQVDRIPVYFAHWPDPRTDVRLTMEFLARQQAIGRIGEVGCSNFSAAQLAAACEVTRIEYAQLPVNILGAGPDENMLRVLAEHRVTVYAYNVLAMGMLSGNVTASSVFPPEDRRSRLPQFRGVALTQNLLRVRVLADQAADAGVTLVQHAIRSVLDLPYVAVAIVGIKSRSQLAAALAASAARPTPDSARN